MRLDYVPTPPGSEAGYRSFQQASDSVEPRVADIPTVGKSKFSKKRSRLGLRFPIPEETTTFQPLDLVCHLAIRLSMGYEGCLVAAPHSATIRQWARTSQ